MNITRVQVHVNKSDNPVKAWADIIIAHLIDLFFNPPPAVRAAQALYDMGLRSKDMKMKYLVKIPPFIGDPIALSVINALRDIERTNK